MVKLQLPILFYIPPCILNECILIIYVLFPCRYQMGDFTGEVLSEVTAPLAEKPVYTVPITVTNGNRHNHKAEIKIKVILGFLSAITLPLLPGGGLHLTIKQFRIGRWWRMKPAAH